MPLPCFDEQGLLPPGDYELTFEELRRSILVQGPTGRDTFDVAWRRQLVDNLEILVGQLWQVGIRDVYIGGSFVSSKDHPSDIDGYYVCEREDCISGSLFWRLSLVDVQRVWSWDPTLPREPSRLRRLLRMVWPGDQDARRARYAGMGKSPMWHRYRIELFPYYGQLTSGIRFDQGGHNADFPAAFRKTTRDDRPKGIVKVVMGPTPIAARSTGRPSLH